MPAIPGTIASGEPSVPAITTEDAARRRSIAPGSRVIAAFGIAAARERRQVPAGRAPIAPGCASIAPKCVESRRDALLSLRYGSESERWPLLSHRDGFESQRDGDTPAGTAFESARHRVSGVGTTVSWSGTALNCFGTAVSSFGTAEGCFCTTRIRSARLCVAAGVHANASKPEQLPRCFRQSGRCWD